MYKDRLRWVEQWQGLLYASTCLEQLASLIAYADVETKVVVGLEIVNYLPGKVVHIYHDALIT